jgi:hypothetical protein
VLIQSPRVHRIARGLVGGTRARSVSEPRSDAEVAV